MISPNTLKFLKSLKRNNNKEWFHKNREAYELAREDFHVFVSGVLEKLKAADPDLQPIEARKCLFRINRDIRFSNNKQPYKNNFGAFMNKGGKQSPTAGYYLHLEPGNSFLAGGIWMPEAPQLQAIRQEIDYNLDEFTGILREKRFKKYFPALDQEAVLTRPPKGYDIDNPALPFLKLKSFTITMGLEDDILTTKKLATTVSSAWESMVPFVHFLNRALG
ncbi:MAG: DUF2461 domain-containing protein [Bacteroidota bacterium]